ncbi:DUF3618 domain-containing protein [Pseudonocardia sichuanensis]
MTSQYPAGSTPSPTPTDPDEIRREIERTQSHLSDDVGALTEKVTPGRVVERRVARARSTAARWKENVMGSSPGHGGGHDVRETAHQVAGSATGTASSAASGVSDAASSAADAVAEAPSAARRQAQGNPLAAGLIAFGAGWLVSSLLPAARREQELAGRARERATELGKPVAEAARQAATEVKDELAGPAQEAVGAVRSTASDAGRTVADEGRSAAGRVQNEAQDAAGTVQQSTQR